MCLSIVALAVDLGSIPGEAAKKRQKNVGAEVFHGEVVPFGKYPFMAAVGLSDGAGGLEKKFCGGSLIGPSSVLTAAHCAYKASPGELAVQVGATQVGASQGEARTVIGINVHPEFRKRTLKFDVAVLTLDRPIGDITPIVLVSSGDTSLNVQGAPLTVLGWGNTVGSRGKRPRTRFPDELREKGIAVVGNSRCHQRWRRAGIKNAIPGSTALCSTGNRFGPGDSGGPVFTLVNGAPMQVGLVSAGVSSFAKVTRHVPDLSTRLSDSSIAAFVASVKS
jgi:secreted trypsin-like serine protease